MKKSPDDYTAGETEYLKRKAAALAGKPLAEMYFKSLAVTEDGQLCIGMTYSNEWRRYSCSAMIIDGVRVNEPRRWNKAGYSLDGDLSALNIGSVHQGVRVI